jgi:hypothetical protein
MFVFVATFIIIATGEPLTNVTYKEPFPTEQACQDFAKSEKNMAYLNHLVQESDGKLSYTGKCVQKDDGGI